MADAFLLGRILLGIGSGAEDETEMRNLSAATFDSAGALWLASDELREGRVTLSRLATDGRAAFTHPAHFDLGRYVDLPRSGAETDEADIEGLDFAENYLWFLGSHSAKRGRPRGRNPEKDLARLARVRMDPNRCLLGRIPLLDGAPVRSRRHPERPAETLTAARLAHGLGGDLLLEALRDDPHLGPFVAERQSDDGKSATVRPGKENGLDLEGLAVFDERVLIGMRGPVLRGWAILLEIEPVDQAPGRLALAPVDADGRRYRKHFLDLGGLGIRDLARDGHDLLIMAGPTMPLEGAQRLYRLREASRLSPDSFTGDDDAGLEPLGEIPRTGPGDHAEGITLLDWPGSAGFLVVYDTPSPRRCPVPGSVWADVFRLDLPQSGGA